MPSTKTRRYGWGFLTLGLWVCVAHAQLKTTDIATLQSRGAKEGWTFRVGLNEAAKHPRSALCGLVEPENWQARRSASVEAASLAVLPSSYDMRSYGWLPPVRDQGNCGSCWAFAVVGVLESAILRVDGVTADLSEQWLVSCNQSGYDCGGGWFDAHDYHAWRTDPCGGYGAVMESACPYLAGDTGCGCPYDHPYRIQTWNYIAAGADGIPSVDSIKQAILTYGAVSAGVYANDAFVAYTGGVFNNNDDRNINHAVLLVGWNDAEQAWIARNSWGANWGENGYMRIRYGCSRIGYGACYVVYNGASAGGLQVIPVEGFTARGQVGGPFIPSNTVYTLRNSGTTPLAWTVLNTQSWITVSSSSGTLAAGVTTSVTLSVDNAAARSLPSGAYAGDVTFGVPATGASETRTVRLLAGFNNYVTELFDSLPNDTPYQTFTFTPDGSASYYAPCRQAAASFPTDPTGGTSLVLGDDGTQPVSLSGTSRVLLYGIAYSTIYINSNGSITFGSGDTAYTESLVNHFGRPRVAALFDDLNPEDGGTISWRQLTDRVAVTFQSVPEYNMHNENSFQMELFFDGTIRITVLNLSAVDGLIGLSQGLGVPIDFVESDFTAFGSCDVLPPVAPANVRATDGDYSDKVRVTWDAVPGAAGYEVWRHSTSNLASAVRLGSARTSPVDDTSVVVTQPYYYWVRATNAAGISAFSVPDPGWRRDPTGNTLAEALDALALTWSTSTGAAWTWQGAVTHDGIDAAQSATVGHNGQSWMQTLAQGPGQLRFWWKVSSEPGYDFLQFTVDGLTYGSISGERGWQEVSVWIGPGAHTLTWSYVKDYSVSSGSDAGWVDQVALTVPTNQPRVLLQAGAGGLAGTWDIGSTGQPVDWTLMTPGLGGGWILRALDGSRVLLQQGDGGLMGIWDLTNGVPVRWWPVSGPLPGWIARDLDGERILLQYGDGGMIGMWQLNAACQPTNWSAISGPLPGIVARALCGQRILLQLGTSSVKGYWTLNDRYVPAAWTPLNSYLPEGWTLRGMSAGHILLQAGESNIGGIWALDDAGVPFQWTPLTTPASGWILRDIDE